MPIQLKDVNGNLVAMTNAQKTQFLSDIGAASADQLQAKQDKVATIALSADRPLSASDSGNNLALSATRSVTIPVGLGSSFLTHFVNTTSSSVNITITGAGGTLINGTANGSVTRSIPANGTLTMRATGTDSYNVPDTSGSGAVAVQALSADRALAAGDLAANLVLTANRAVSLASGLGAGFNTQFSNGGTSSATVTVTPGAGVTINGASTAVTRTLAAGQTTALLPVGANAYILPGA